MAEAGQEETPRTPFPAIPGRGVDERWFHEFRRDVLKSIKDIEALLRQGAVTMERHGGQLEALIAQNADHEGRIEELEAEREQRRTLARASRASLLRKAGVAALIAVVAAGAIAVVGTTCAFIWFLFKMYASAGAPGAVGLTP